PSQTPSSQLMPLAFVSWSLKKRWPFMAVKNAPTCPPVPSINCPVGIQIPGRFEEIIIWYALFVAVGHAIWTAGATLNVMSAARLLMDMPVTTNIAANRLAFVVLLIAFMMFLLFARPLNHGTEGARTQRSPTQAPRSAHHQ